jgi:hypothetical protein
MVKEKRYFAYFILLLLAPELAMANLILPMICFTWPAMWIMLLAVILIEYLVLKRRWPSISKKSLIFDISIGNFFSTLLGVPIAWLIYYYGITEPANKYLIKTINNLPSYLIPPLKVLIYAPIMPYSGEINMYINFILTLLPAYFLSYWIEYFFVNQEGISKQETLLGVRIANRFSYLFVLVVATIFLILSSSGCSDLLRAILLWICEKGMVVLFFITHR